MTDYTPTIAAMISTKYADSEDPAAHIVQMRAHLMDIPHTATIIFVTCCSLVHTAVILLHSD
jgi:hypothetical protein